MPRRADAAEVWGMYLLKVECSSGSSLKIVAPLEVCWQGLGHGVAEAVVGHTAFLWGKVLLRFLPASPPACLKNPVI